MKKIKSPFPVLLSFFNTTKRASLSLLLVLFSCFTHAQPFSIQWEKSFGGSSDDNAYSVMQTADTGYIVAGESYSFNGDVTGSHGNYDYWILKLSSSGGLQWQVALGGSGPDQAFSVRQTTDRGYM